MYQAKIVDSSNPDLDNLKTIKIGWRAGFGLHTTEVLLLENNAPSLHVACFSEADDYHFTSEAVVWHDLLVVGAGHRLFVLNLTDHAHWSIDLGAYYSALYATDALLLVASGQHVHALNRAGTMQWAAEELGIDGVVITEIDATTAYGQGEFDPPGGWKPFKLDLRTGKAKWLD